MEKMDFELSVNDVLTEDEIRSMFSDDKEEKKEDIEENKEGEKKDDSPEEEPIEIKKIAEEFDPEKDLNPESVGNEENDKKTQEEPPSEAEDSSMFYSSIAKALSEEGVFPDVNEELIGNVKTPEELKNLIQEQIKAGLDERQKRIDEALENGVEESDIRSYENSIRYLEGLKEEDIIKEDENGEKLRMNLIYQDYINNGFSDERAKREVKKSIDAGTDVEDAKTALKSNLEYFKKSYEGLLENARKEKESYDEQRKKDAESLKNSIMSTSSFFNEMEIGKDVRQRAYENLMKPVHKDKETGNVMTAIQKYERENKTEFLKNIAFFFTLTDGFKNLDGLVKDKVQKEKKKGLSELEKVIKGSQSQNSGKLQFVTGVNMDGNADRDWDFSI